jgi:enterochelin esterase-like enzyme
MGIYDFRIDDEMMTSRPGRISLFFILFFIFAACAPVSLDLETPVLTPIPTLAVTEPTRTAPVPSPTARMLAVESAPPPVPTEQVCSPLMRQSGSAGQGLMDKPMDYYVLLPPCYEQQTGQDYPVLYLFHGLGSDQEQWLRLGIEEQAARMMQSGEIPPFLIVLPFDYSFRQPGEYRFEEVFLEHLMPEIEAAYRARAERSARAVGGLSRGGAWAIYLASRNPHLFFAVGGHSPVVFPSTGGTLRLLLRDMPPDLRPTFYIDAGDRDVGFRGVQEFSALLDFYGYPHEWRQNLGYHEEAYWREHLEDYLHWYGWQFLSAP